MSWAAHKEGDYSCHKGWKILPTAMHQYGSLLQESPDKQNQASNPILNKRCTPTEITNAHIGWQWNAFSKFIFNKSQDVFLISLPLPLALPLHTDYTHKNHPSSHHDLTMHQGRACSSRNKNKKKWLNRESRRRKKHVQLLLSATNIISYASFHQKWIFFNW